KPAGEPQWSFGPAADRIDTRSQHGAEHAIASKPLDRAPIQLELQLLVAINGAAGQWSGGGSGQSVGLPPHRGAPISLTRLSAWFRSTRCAANQSFSDALAWPHSQRAIA